MYLSELYRHGLFWQVSTSDCVYLSVFKEVVKEMVDDVCCEHPHTKAVSHLLSLSLHPYIKG